MALSRENAGSHSSFPLQERQPGLWAFGHLHAFRHGVHRSVPHVTGEEIQGRLTAILQLSHADVEVISFSGFLTYNTEGHKFDLSMLEGWGPRTAEEYQVS